MLHLQPLSVETTSAHGHNAARYTGTPSGDLIDSASAPRPVFLVAAGEIVRRGLRRIVHEDGRYTVVGEMASPEQALPAIIETDPHLCIVEDRGPGGTGVALCAQITRALPGSRVVVLMAEVSPDHVIDTVAAGASGLLLAGVTAEQLLATLDQVARGRSLLDPVLTGSVFDYFRDRCVDNRVAETPLSRAELTLVGFINRGMSNRQIAEHLGVPDATIKGRVSALMRKLSATSRTQVALHGSRLRERGVDLDPAGESLFPAGVMVAL